MGATKKKGDTPTPRKAVRRRDDVRLAATRCPYCHDDVHPEAQTGASTDEPVVACERCLTRHHDACWDESRRCGACGGRRRLRRGRARAAEGPGDAPRILAGGAAIMGLVLVIALGFHHVATAARARADADAAAAIARAAAERARAEEVAREEAAARREAELRARAEAIAARAARAAEDEALDRSWEEKERARRAAEEEEREREEARARLRRRVRQLNDAAADVLANAALDDSAALQDAARTYRAALELDPRSPTTLSNLAVVLVRQGEYDEALTVCDAAVAADELHFEARITRASARALAGDLRGADEDLSAILKVHPTHPTARANRAAVRLRLGEMTAAIEDASSALRANPEDAASMLARARARAALGELAGARADCEALLGCFRATDEQRAAALEVLGSLSSQQ